MIDSAKRHLFGLAARYLKSGRFGQSRGVRQGSGKGLSTKNLTTKKNNDQSGPGKEKNI